MLMKSTTGWGIHSNEILEIDFLAAEIIEVKVLKAEILEIEALAAEVVGHPVFFFVHDRFVDHSITSSNLPNNPLW